MFVIESTVMQRLKAALNITFSLKSLLKNFSEMLDISLCCQQFVEHIKKTQNSRQKKDKAHGSSTHTPVCSYNVLVFVLFSLLFDKRYIILYIG